MKLIIKKNPNDEYGELVEMNGLKAKYLIKKGKAHEINVKEAWLSIKDLYFCGFSRINDMKTRYRKGGVEEITRFATRSSYKIAKNMEDDDLWLEIRNRNLYSSLKSLEIMPFLNKDGTPYVFYVDYKRPLEQILKQHNLWQDDWTKDTYLHYSLIKSLEKHLCCKLYETLPKNIELTTVNGLVKSKKVETDEEFWKEQTYGV
ncbi:MAG: hypothetical protein IJX26_01840 [Clostridia bacterium]|nr:hypothetical protein [Clostridia bacterium]